MSGVLVEAQGHQPHFCDRGRPPAMIDPVEIEEWKKSLATCASGYLATGAVLELRLAS